MSDSTIPHTEEQIRTILTLTHASREEVIHTIAISRVSIDEIISCLQKASKSAVRTVTAP